MKVKRFTLIICVLLIFLGSYGFEDISAKNKKLNYKTSYKGKFKDDFYKMKIKIYKKNIISIYLISKKRFYL